MSKYEFIKELRAYISDYLPSAKVEESVRYYEKYISEAVGAGKTEAQVISELGDPRIIGKSIVDSETRKGTYSDRPEHSSGSDTYGSGRTKAEMNGKLKTYGIIALIIAIVLVVLIAITKVVAFFFPLIVVVLLLAIFFRRNGGGK